MKREQWVVRELSDGFYLSFDDQFCAFREDNILNATLFDSREGALGQIKSTGFNPGAALAIVPITVDIAIGVGEVVSSEYIRPKKRTR